MLPPESRLFHLSGQQIARLMRRHGWNIRDLARAMGLTQAKVRLRREKGTDHLYASLDWVEALTGNKWSGTAEDLANTAKVWAWIRQQIEAQP